MTSAAKVLEDVRARVADRAAVAPAELRVGTMAHEALSNAAGWRLAHGGQLLDALFGVVIWPAPALDPWRWRLLDADGGVITEGVVDPA